jgi:hypothetical protein
MTCTIVQQVLALSVEYENTVDRRQRVQLARQAETLNQLLALGPLPGR